MTTIEKIKAKIFDLAIRGKLVPQDPNDEPALELLKRIRAEKNELVKAKKIKKEKNPSEIIIGSDGKPYEKFADGKTVCIEDEIPFNLPNGWAWARVGDVFDLRAGKNIKADCIYEQASPGHPFACFGGNGIRGYVDSSNVQGIHAIIGRQGALCGNINLSTEKFYATEHAVVVTTFANTEALFAFHFLKAMNLNRLATATAQPGLSVAIVNQNLMPVPPLAEQKRIVSKIEELFAEAVKISVALDGVTRVMERINKKVLDLAIRGQLVPQDPNDEPAEELLKRIAEARQRNANKKSRRSKCEESVIFYSADRSAYETRNGKTVCIDDEIPFEIPDSWAWARLRTVLLPMESKLPSGEWFEYIDIDAIDNKRNRVTTPKKLKVVDAPSRASRGLKTGDTLFSVVRPYLRNIAHINARLTNCIASTGFYVCRPSAGVDDQYLFNLLCTDYVVNGLNAFMKGDNSPSIRVEHIHDFIVPIPPLAEQKRIVAKVREVRNFVELITQT